MKNEPARNIRQAAIVLRLTTGILALVTIIAFGALFLRPAQPARFLAYQCSGLLLGLLVFTLTFEQHFAEYWHIAAALFFSLWLLIWSGVAFSISGPIPIWAVIVVVPIATVLLPWNWQFQLGMCGLCVGTALLTGRFGPAATLGCPLWMIASAESAVAVLASMQLELQRRQAEAYYRALVADEEQFRALIENAPDGLCVFNAAGTIVFQSPSAKRILGTNEDMVGRSVYEFLHQDDVGKFRSLLSECAKSPDRSHEIMVRCRHADGPWLTIEGLGRHLQNYGTEPLVVLNWRDVTERVVQENRIRESEDKFRKIFQYCTNPISIISRNDGRYLDVNDEWLRVFGYARCDVIGRDPLELGRWADRLDYLLYVSELLSKGEIRNHPAVLRVKDGALLPGLVSSVLVETGGTPVVLSIISLSSGGKPELDSDSGLER